MQRPVYPVRVTEIIVEFCLAEAEGLPILFVVQATDGDAFAAYVCGQSVAYEVVGALVDEFLEFGVDLAVHALRVCRSTLELSLRSNSENGRTSAPSSGELPFKHTGLRM